jgi:phosphopantetheinyl transferase
MNTEAGEKTLADSLSREELEMLSKLALAKRRREWLGGRLAAKYAAAKLLKLTTPSESPTHCQDYRILADENGRPYLDAASNFIAHPAPDISISHSGSFAAAMAVHQGYGGIDIQKITLKVMKVQDRFCTPDEERTLLGFFSPASKNIVGPLTKLWAAKEALRKASQMKSLPGFLEMELAEITGGRSQDNATSHCFIFNMASSAGFASSCCRVAVADIEDYVLALSARSDTLG